MVVRTQVSHDPTALMPRVLCRCRRSRPPVLGFGGGGGGCGGCSGIVVVDPFKAAIKLIHFRFVSSDVNSIRYDSKAGHGGDGSLRVQVQDYDGAI